VWKTGSVAVVAGANLFKFGPLVGELLADDSTDELSPDHALGSASSEPARAAGPART